MGWTLLGVTLAMAWVSTRCRLKINYRRMNSRGGPEGLPAEIRETAISKALTQLVATAGGIYISLVLLFSFLDVSTGAKWDILGVEVDALAVVSLAVALCQPILLNFYEEHFV